MIQTQILAAAYGEGDYGESFYSGCETNTVTGVCESVESGGTVLVNTGTGILIAVSLAIAIIFVALFIKVIRKPSSPPADKQ